MPSLATDELLAAYRARLRTCRLSMRHAWIRHLEALRNGCPDEIEATRDEYEATEPPFNEVAAGIASRVKLLSGGLAVGERVEIACPSGVEPVVGTVVDVKREFRVWWACGRKWTEMQDRYRVCTPCGTLSLWIDDIAPECESEVKSRSDRPS